jgi:hypothetical protein
MYLGKSSQPQFHDASPGPCACNPTAERLKARQHNTFCHTNTTLLVQAHAPHTEGMDAVLHVSWRQQAASMQVPNKKGDPCTLEKLRRQQLQSPNGSDCSEHSLCAIVICWYTLGAAGLHTPCTL